MSSCVKSQDLHSWLVRHNQVSKTSAFLVTLILVHFAFFVYFRGPLGKLFLGSYCHPMMVCLPSRFFVSERGTDMRSPFQDAAWKHTFLVSSMRSVGDLSLRVLFFFHIGCSITVLGWIDLTFVIGVVICSKKPPNGIATVAVVNVCSLFIIWLCKVVIYHLISWWTDVYNSYSISDPQHMYSWGCCSSEWANIGCLGKRTGAAVGDDQ